jgi:Tetracyclin repressor-like, C-terminal domain
MNLPSHTSEESAALAENVLREFPADKYPLLAEMALDHALKPGCDCAQDFEFGLDLILDGLGGSEVSPDAALSMEAAS